MILHTGMIQDKILNQYGLLSYHYNGMLLEGNHEF